MEKIGIIFDMDGTLWDSAESVAKSWTTIVKKEYPKLGEISTQDIKSVMGLTMDRIAELLFGALPKEEQLALLDQCGEFENAYLREHGAVLYPRLRETMEKLKESYRLFIVSNCQSGYIEAFLDYYGFEELFEDIECYGNNGFKKGDNIRLVVERNKLERAYYVGDIMGDYEAACEAGIGFVHAAYGFGEVAADVPRINSLSELPAVMADIVSAS